MKIERFWAKGYRSLVDVELAGLGPINVFYGPNGSGKSNVLEALRTLHRLIALLLTSAPNGTEGAWIPDVASGSSSNGGLSLARQAGLIGDADPTVWLPEIDLHLGAEWAVGGSHDLYRRLGLERLRIQVSYTAPLRSGGGSLRFSTFELDRGRGWTPVPPVVDEGSRASALVLAAVVKEFIGRECFDLIEAHRLLKSEAAEDAPRDCDDIIRWHLDRGRVKQAIFLASTSPQHSRRESVERLRRLLQGPPLERPPFVPVQDPYTRRVDLREAHPRGGDVSLDMAGLGIAQLYSILARAMLSRASIVAIEEPEAHLYERGGALHLRALLQRMVREGLIDQLFLATHSSVFDLDDRGYFDVRLENHETRIERRPLDALDRHLYEPGPTLHAFEELLRISDPDKVMARDPEGRPVTTSQMLAHLRAADPVALEYLEDLHRAAVDMLGGRARRGTP